MHLITHSGPFHSDDLITYGILSRLFPNNRLTRTREQEIIKQGDLVFDVGMVYNEARNRFDHHFIGAPKRDVGVTYSSAGLVWKRYGREYLNIVGGVENFEQIDREFITCVDSRDTGYRGHKPEYLVEGEEKSEPILDMLRKSDLTWLEDTNEFRRDELFKYLGRTFERGFAEFCKDMDCAKLEKWLADNPIIKGRTAMYEDSVNKAVEYMNSKLESANSKGVDYLEFDYYIPWSEIMDPKDEKYRHINYVVYHDNNSWKCQCAPTDKGGFESKMPLPKKWRGIDQDKLRAKTGVKDAIFCHPAGFIMGAESRKGVQTLLNLAKERIMGLTTVTR